MALRRLPVIAILATLCWWTVSGEELTPHVQFVVSSDAHYGITRPTFRGRTNVDARDVNVALVDAVNSLAGATFPDDGGIGAGEPVGPVDFLAETGDIANRMEVDGGRQVQSAAASIAQFTTDYIDGLELHTRSGGRTPVLPIPGNHDASNAVGFHRMMTPSVDPSAIVDIYNRTMSPATKLTPDTFRYNRDKVHYARDVGGVHFQFISIWPDTAERAWMEQDLARVAPSTPVIVFAHDQLDAEAKHFTNPHGLHDINASDLFENLLADVFEDGDVAAESLIEQRELEAFLRRHPAITAYFHGNSNWNQFYDYVGPDHSIALHTFRVDSPMKGRFSMPDETKLSFQIATIDPTSLLMTVREVLWNTMRVRAPLVWGASTTVAIRAR